MVVEVEVVMMLRASRIRQVTCSMVCSSFIPPPAINTRAVSVRHASHNKQTPLQTSCRGGEAGKSEGRGVTRSRAQVGQQPQKVVHSAEEDVTQCWRI